MKRKRKIINILRCFNGQIAMSSKAVDMLQWDGWIVILLPTIINFFTSSWIMSDSVSRKLPTNSLIINISIIQFLRTVLHMFGHFEMAESCKIHYVEQKLCATCLLCTKMFIIISRYQQNNNQTQSRWCNKWSMISTNLSIWIIGMGLSFLQYRFVSWMKFEVDGESEMKCYFVKKMKDYEFQILNLIITIVIAIIFSVSWRFTCYQGDWKKVMTWIILTWMIIDSTVFLLEICDIPMIFELQQFLKILTMIFPTIYYWTSLIANEYK
ncbi:hypothetical protein TKK_0010707 [Trichogramma kaykai]